MLGVDPHLGSAGESVHSIIRVQSSLLMKSLRKPPIHLHVQPDRSITITNLRDLGVQNQTFMKWVVDLPISKQNFSFAYNTIANQFVVFQSDGVLQVGPGETSCLNAAPSSSSQSTSGRETQSGAQIASSTTLVSSSTVTTTGGTITTTGSNSLSPSSQAAATQSSNGNSIPVAAIAGGVAGGIVIGCALMGGFLYLLCWRRKQPSPGVDALEAKLEHSPSDRHITPFIAPSSDDPRNTVPTASQLNLSSAGRHYPSSSMGSATSPSSSKAHRYGAVAASLSSPSSHSVGPTSPPGVVSPTLIPVISPGLASPGRQSSEDPPPTYQV
ncbi:hypothetical protein HGRIS_010586 [Hohenbuehelia grisea]|uniref:Peptidase A1 domain-containing protein n=1 Tax=Hohenbuehelia grisea TaxID=104357 RepID=A0ABR3IXD5_9AGAR